MIHFHLPIVHNRIAQFHARFVPVPTGGWAWFRNDWSAGLPVSDAERADLLDSHAARIWQAAEVVRWWTWLNLGIVAIAVLALHGEIQTWWGMVLFAAPVGYAVIMAWRADRLPLAVCATRFPALPPRGLARGAAARLRALPLSVPLLMVGVGALLLFRLWQEGQIGADRFGTVIGIGVLLFGLTILDLRRRAP